MLASHALPAHLTTATLHTFIFQINRLWILSVHWEQKMDIFSSHLRPLDQFTAYILILACISML